MGASEYMAAMGERVHVAAKGQVVARGYDGGERERGCEWGECLRMGRVWTVALAHGDEPREAVARELGRGRPHPLLGGTRHSGASDGQRVSPQ